MPGRIVLYLAALGVPICSCVTPNGTSEPAAETAEAIAPRPFSADQIRDANPPGTVLVFRTTTPDGLSFERFEFGETDGETVQLGGQTTDEQGRVLELTPASQVSWTELRDHATFPAAITGRSTGSVSVPAGTFPCTRYAVQRPDGSLETYCFATQRPGPPVLLTIESQGVVALRMELIEVLHPAG